MPNGRVDKIVSLRRFDIQLPASETPPLYANVEVVNSDGRVVCRGVVWRTRESGLLWEDFPAGWARCIGHSKSVESNDTVRVLASQNRFWSRFGRLLEWSMRLANRYNIPRAKAYLQALPRRDQLKDQNLYNILSEILDGVVTNLGYEAAMLATYEPETNVLPAYVLKVRPGREWMMEYTEDLCGVRIVGNILDLNEQQDNIVTHTVMDAVAGKGKGYRITRSLYDLWGYTFQNSESDHWLVWLLQHALPMRTFVVIPFVAQQEDGTRVLVGNMFAGHRKWWLSQRDIKILQAVVRQASYAIENAQLYRLEETRRSLEHERRMLAEERQSLAEHRARDMETMVGMAQVVTKLTHRMTNNLGLVRSRLDRQIYRDKPADSIFLNKILNTVDDTIDIVKEMVRPFSETSVMAMSLVETIEEAIELMTLGENLAIERSPALAEMPAVRADSSLVEVFRVLLNNASDAMNGQGTIEIDARRHGNRIVATIKDSGVGIPPEHHDDIFQLLYSTKLDSKKGAGLGLWWVRFYLREIDSNISVQSSVGTGATFKVSLHEWSDHIDRSTAGLGSRVSISDTGRYRKLEAANDR